MHVPLTMGAQSPPGNWVMHASPRGQSAFLAQLPNSGREAPSGVVPLSGSVASIDPGVASAPNTNGLHPLDVAIVSAAHVSHDCNESPRR